MSNRNFTDEDIIKALELCFTPKGTKYTCAKCPFREFRALCKVERDRAALALIYRQRAKNEALQMDNAQLQSDVVNANMNLDHVQAELERLGRDRYQILPDGRIELIPRTDIKAIKAKAIKEFAERLLKKIYPYNGVDKKQYAINARAVEKAIEDLVKEMTEGHDESQNT